FQGVAATRAAREYAADALDAEQKKLESGKSTTYTVLQMQRDLTAARGAEITALATYNKALTQLSLDEATILERLGIRVSLRQSGGADSSPAPPGRSEASFWLGGLAS